MGRGGWAEVGGGVGRVGTLTHFLLNLQEVDIRGTFCLSKSSWQFLSLDRPYMELCSLLVPKSKQARTSESDLRDEDALYSHNLILLAQAIQDTRDDLGIHREDLDRDDELKQAAAAAYFELQRTKPFGTFTTRVTYSAQDGRPATEEIGRRGELQGGQPRSYSSNQAFVAARSPELASVPTYYDLRRARFTEKAANYALKDREFLWLCKNFVARGVDRAAYRNSIVWMYVSLLMATNNGFSLHQGNHNAVRSLALEFYLGYIHSTPPGLWSESLIAAPEEGSTFFVLADALYTP